MRYETDYLGAVAASIRRHAGNRVAAGVMGVTREDISLLVFLTAAGAAAIAGWWFVLG
ncbi:MAG TPA: hypothetical protein PLH23_07910 [Hyphomonadaceae bacterium]|nr:hypothetical protein [Hyphomonadaceae bacterium]